MDLMSGIYGDDLGGPCDLAPCTPFFSPMGPIYYKQDAHSDTVGNAGVVEQEQFAEDFKQWAAERDEACEDWTLSGVTLSSIGGPTAYACAAFETGAGAVVCAGGLLAFAVEWWEYSEQLEQCSASYPGPGNW